MKIDSKDDLPFGAYRKLVASTGYLFCLQSCDAWRLVIDGRETDGREYDSEGVLRSVKFRRRDAHYVDAARRGISMTKDYILGRLGLDPVHYRE